MDSHTLQFITFAAVSLAALWAGYAARKRGWLDERHSRTVHFHTVLWVWTTAAVLSLWGLKITGPVLWLLLIQPVIMFAGAVGVIPLARLIGCDRRQTGVLAVAAGVSNCGFTLGGYLCYSILHPPELALSYAIVFLSVMQASAIVALYPLARHFSDQHDQTTNLWRLLVANLWDLRSLPIYAAVAGVLLAWFAVPGQDVVHRWHLIDAMFYLGGVGGYFGIGMRLRLGRSLSYLRQHVLLAAVRFIGLPLVAAGMLGVIQHTPWPMDATAVRVVMIEAFMPTAILTVIIANLFHLDARLASVAWLWNTLAFMVLVLPVLLWWFA